MSGSNRGIYIIATIGAFAFFGLGVAGESRCQREYYANYSQNTAEYPSGSKSLRFDRGWIPCLVERETTNPQISEATEKEQRDLMAQEAMALWAFWVAAFAGITAIITSAGTILIWRQVRLTREAVEDTGKATTAMLKANEIAAAAQRAWIDITPVFELQPTTDKGFYLATAAGFKNIGKTIATNVYTMSRFRTGSAGQITAEHNKLFREMIRSGGGLTLVPGKEMAPRGQRQNGYSENLVNWDENGKSCFCIISIAVYNVEGDNRKRYSRAMWYLHKKQGPNEFSDHSMTWDEFTSGEIEVDPLSYLDCT